MLGAGLLFVKLVSLLCGFIIHDETCTSESHDTVEYFARVLQSNDRFTDLHDKKSLLKDKIHELLLLVDEVDSPDGVTTAIKHLLIGIHSLKAMINDLVHLHSVYHYFLQEKLNPHTNLIFATSLNSISPLSLLGNTSESWLIKVTCTIRELCYEGEHLHKSS